MKGIKRRTVKGVKWLDIDITEIFKESDREAIQISSDNYGFSLMMHKK